ncbi:MAG: hypothetical protein V4474_01690 [Patescibacteria group bacterium]
MRQRIMGFVCNPEQGPVSPKLDKFVVALQEDGMRVINFVGVRLATDKAFEYSFLCEEKS